MGTKSAAKKGHGGEELKNNDVDSSLVGAGEGFSLSNYKEKKKRKSRDAKSNNSELCAAEIEGVNVEVDVNVNDNEMEKEKKKKNKEKRKSEQSNVDVESCKIGKQDKAADIAGDVTEIAETEVDFKEGQTEVGVEMGPHESGAGKDRKKNHKVRKSKDKSDSSSSVPNVPKNNLREIVDERQEVSGREDDFEMNKGDDGGRKRKKNRKTKMHGDGANAQVIISINDRKEVESERSNRGKNIVDSVKSPQKERKKKKRRSNVDGEATSPIFMAETPANKCNIIEEDGTNMGSAGNETRERKLGAGALNKDEKRKRKRKKRKREQEMDKGIGAANSSEKSTPKGTSKRVSFAEEVEVFSSSDGPSDEESVQEKELVRGKRFSPQEDEMVKEAVLEYIDNHGLGEEGLTMVLNCRKYPEVKNCWKEIRAALPWRPYESVYHRAHVLFQRAEKRSWTEEECEFIRNYNEKHGSKWKDMADALGRHRFHVKDTWRRIKLTTEKKGKWSQDEYQNLFDLVNMDLRMKALEEVRKSKHGMLRDNICWTAISEKLGTRSTPLCCMKWYNQLTSPMVAEGKWLDVDDYHLLIALYDLDACCMEDVDWDSLLDHRPGDICRKRWNQMVKHLGNKSFAEQVEVLIGRYCPDVLEAREAYYSKPLVP